jgi:hypothetical protein
MSPPNLYHSRPPGYHLKTYTIFDRKDMSLPEIMLNNSPTDKK